MINVACAIIENEENRILCAQRSKKMNLPFKWEFPGGKVEVGETLEDCLKREIKEELNIEIEIHYNLPYSFYKYEFTDEICFHPFICKVISGEIILKEHKQIKWLTKSELFQLDWAEADLPILKKYLSIKI